MFDNMMNALLKKLFKNVLKSLAEEMESAARNENDHSASSALYSVAHVLGSSDVEWEVSNVIPTDDDRCARLMYQLEEMIGVVTEFRDMPCKSLEQRMIAQLPRAQKVVDDLKQPELDM